MTSTQSFNIEDNNTAMLFEQVIGQIVEQCVQTGIMSKHQIVNILEDMIQQIERGTLSSTLDTI